jgi:hypothetical protein
MVSGLIATRFGVPGIAPSREVLEAHIDKVIIHAEAVEVGLRTGQKPGNRDSGSPGPLEISSLRWVRKPNVVAKGVVHAPSDQSAGDPKARDAALAAIGKAHLWLEEILAGSTFAEIARREGKGERQIRLLLPLAFAPPATVRGLIDGTAAPATVTEMARNVPLVWA